MSEQSNICPQCRRPFPTQSPGGLCPHCLLAMNLGTGSQVLTADVGAQAETDPSLSVDEVAVMFPQLEVIGLIGRGGMGIVYKARQKQLDRLVALKILSPKHEADPAFGERFTREAQALARLNHPGIVTVFDFGRVDGRFYLLMEYVEGVSLRHLLAETRLAPEEALKVVPMICDALQFAHEQGVVHRDIKPENILLDRAGRVKIADFGIAKIMGVGHPQTLTGAKDVVGTPHYMAPEQVEKPQTVDHRADIYSLGVVFYEMLTGELPLGKFAAPSRKVQVDVRLDEIVLRALEKEPERRYQRAVQVKADVETVVSGGASAFAEPGPRTGRPSWLHTSALVARWAARVLGTAILLFYGTFVLAEGLPPIGSQPGGVQLGFLALALVFAGCLSGWKHDGWGAILTWIGWGFWQVSEGSIRPTLFQAPLLVAVLYSFAWYGIGRRTRVLAWVAATLATVMVLGFLLVPSNVFLNGKVLDASTGQPIPGAQLYLTRAVGQQPASAEPSSRSDNGGSYHLYVGWFQSRARLRIVAPGYSVLETALGHRAPGVRRISRDFALDPLNALEPGRELAEVAPVVVATVPQSGTEGIDPSTEEIRVTFSKPMTPEGWSWCRVDQTAYPEITGKPAFLKDRRTCVLPVRLDPGTTYALWLNDDASQDFTDQQGRAAVPYLLIFETRR